MNRHESPTEGLVLLVPCPRCEARPGDWCTTTTGNRRARLHGRRRSPVETAYANGYTEGFHDGTEWKR